MSELKDLFNNIYMWIIKQMQCLELTLLGNSSSFFVD